MIPMLCAISGKHNLLDNIEPHWTVRPVSVQDFTKRGSIRSNEALTALNCDLVFVKLEPNDPLAHRVEIEL